MRILFLSDTHLGFDLPMRPRVERHRRGHDFFANTRRALEPALRKDVDCVVHGGDLLFRSRVPARLVDLAFEPFLDVARAGIPVHIVPGNHERSCIPQGLLHVHENIRIFHRPGTFVVEKQGQRLALAGFPFVAGDVRASFGDLLRATRWREARAQGCVLCIHQCVEGATVGPVGYTFRHRPDTIRTEQIPPGIAAVLAGHVHRYQVLTRDLRGRPLSTPVLYSGSIERTSMAERDEVKGFIVLELGPGGSGLRARRWSFHPLPTGCLPRGVC